MGIMDVTYKELTDMLSDESFSCGDISEVCRAVRGYSGKKYDRIRRRLMKAFSDWLADLEREGMADSIRPYIRMKNIAAMNAKPYVRLMMENNNISYERKHGGAL